MCLWMRSNASVTRMLWSSMTISLCEMVRMVKTERLSHWTATMASSHFHRLRALKWRLGGLTLSSEGTSSTSRMVRTLDQQYTSFTLDIWLPVWGSGTLSFTAGNQARQPLRALCGATSFGLGDLCCVFATGVVDTMTKR